MRWVISIAVVLLLLPRAAQACGACKEDDRSAVYTHEAMEQVRANPDRLEFVVLKVRGPLRQKEAAQIETWLRRQEGVDPSTVKISVPQKSIGFVLEKKRSKATLAARLHDQFPRFSFQSLPAAGPL